MVRQTKTSAISSCIFSKHSSTLFVSGSYRPVPGAASIQPVPVRMLLLPTAPRFPSWAGCLKLFCSLLFSFQPVVQLFHARGAKNERPVWRTFITTFFDFHFSDSVRFAVPRKALAASVANLNLNIIEPYSLSPISLAARPRHTANGHAAFLL